MAQCIQEALVSHADKSHMWTNLPGVCELFLIEHAGALFFSVVLNEKPSKMSGRRQRSFSSHQFTTPPAAQWNSDS